MRVIRSAQIRPRELVEQLPRPLSLSGDPDAYALTIVGASMWPRFHTGSRVAVSLRSPVAIGDGVLVRLCSPGATAANGLERVLIMHLVKRTTDMFKLRQFNPDRIIQVGTNEVEAILKIVGELI